MHCISGRFPNRLLSGILAGVLAISMILPLTGCGSKAAPGDEPTREAPAQGSAPIYPAMVRGKDFCLPSADGSFQPVYLSGVNMGAAKPGYFPGEFGITKEDYLRWFGMIGDMHVQVVRVYVAQMPAFYDALLEFNTAAKEPLYLIHGVYMNESLTDEYGDVFGGDGALQESFHDDIRKTVDILHGNASFDPVPGSAGGTYTSDVSPWVIGWILGVEWSADLVMRTNDAHPDKASFSGTYVRTRDASPFEVFLAGAAEEAIGYEMAHYGTQRPVALSNWCTTDPLSHSNEPDPGQEDAVSVDPEHILATDLFGAGFFASYHVYPYYPDFLSYDTRYAQAESPYLAYLMELNSYHTMPVLISEYGIPSSRGIAHSNAVSGMRQGLTSEQEQGQLLAALSEDIRSAGCAGGLIFSWQDEWFKRCWNTMDYEDPERRPYWLNVQSPESNFGLLAFDPGSEPTVTLDGDPSEWNDSDVIAENDGLRLSARSDAAWLYLLLSGEDFRFERDTVYIPLDTLAGQGSKKYEDMRFEAGAEFLLRLQGKDGSVLLVDPCYDVFQYDYAVRHSFFPVDSNWGRKNSGAFNPIYLATSRELYLPQTGNTVPFQRVQTGVLHCGAVSEDSLSDLCPGNGCVEIRLPWNLLGFTDPSRKMVIGDLTAGDGIVGTQTDGIRMGICRPGGHTPMPLYTWDNWDIPETRERLKASYFYLRDYFA